MMLTGTGKFVRESHPTEVTVYKEDGYIEAAKKAAEVLGISIPEDRVLVLLRPSSGAVIPPLKDDTFPWTVGDFLRQQHVRADKIEFGIPATASKVYYLYSQNCYQMFIVIMCYFLEKSSQPAQVPAKSEVDTDIMGMNK